jgi:hypothetical protein
MQKILVFKSPSKSGKKSRRNNARNQQEFPDFSGTMVFSGNPINHPNDLNHLNAQNDLNETNQTNRKTRAGDERVIPIPKLPELRYTLGYLYERRDRSNPLVFPSKSLRRSTGKGPHEMKGG